MKQENKEILLTVKDLNKLGAELTFREVKK